ncbi:universal stress protein [Mycobacterium sherrisii]|uniref:universal stress protein n=1 Tax=Mycobacterium sherrisii TaxID=243061 RepID=UPI0039756E12
MDHQQAKSVVVGIDGSKAATSTALWAVGEAVSRDVPLRLVCVVAEPPADGRGPDDIPRDRTAAETALRRAATAIESTGQPVKIETQTVRAEPIEALIRASATAAMVCVGAIGLHHFQVGRLGSTAAALSVSARCPVAIVRSQRTRPGRQPGGIVVAISSSSDDEMLLAAATTEARLRNAALRVVFCHHTGSADDRATHDSERRAKAHLDSRLARWRRRYPDLDVESTAVCVSLVDYLAHSHQAVQLVVVGPHDCERLNELMGPAGSAVLQEAGCSIVVVNHPRHL